jgi:O-antigen ligase
LKPSVTFVQNEYASLLLEAGITGIALIVYTAVLILKALKKSANLEMNLTLIFGYGITLLFFAGLPNVLHIYIIPAVLPYGKS